MSAYREELKRTVEKLDAVIHEIPVQKLSDIVRGLGFALSATYNTSSAFKDLEDAKKLENMAKDLRHGLDSLKSCLERKGGISKWN